MIPFKERVYDLVSKVPYGKISTYGQIAAMMGNVKMARQVGFALRALSVNEREVPWWRIINRKGYISINNTDPLNDKELLKKLLEEEGVEVDESYTIDLEKYLWDGQEER